MPKIKIYNGEETWKSPIYTIVENKVYNGEETWKSPIYTIVENKVYSGEETWKAPVATIVGNKIYKGEETWKAPIATIDSDTSRDDDDNNSWIGKIIGFLLVAAAVIWFVFAIVVPLIIINIATIALIAGLAKKAWTKILFPVSILGSILIIFDYNKGWATKALVENVSFFKGSIQFFYYINIAAGLVAAYFQIRNYLNAKNPPAENEKEFSKRNLIVMGCLVLLGGLTIGGQKYFDGRGSVPTEIPLQSRDSSDYPIGDEGISSDLEQNKVRLNPRKKYYSGKIGKSDAQYEMVWNSDGTIEGIYHNPKKPNITYLLKGKDWGNGKVLLTEFTGDAVSANCELFLQNNCYSGKMHNTDGRVLQMTMCLNQITKNGPITLSGKFPQGTERLLSPNDLAGLSKEDLKIMRNEIFARHGYIFKTPEMKAYFAAQTWYHGQYEDVTSMLSEIEKQNIELIKKHE